MECATSQLEALRLQENKRDAALPSDRSGACDAAAHISSDRCSGGSNDGSDSDDWADPVLVHSPGVQESTQAPPGVLSRAAPEAAAPDLQGTRACGNARQRGPPAPGQGAPGRPASAIASARLHGKAGSREQSSSAEQQPLPTALRDIPFEGGHVLEFFGLTSKTITTHLEAALTKVDRGRLPAVVRWVDDERAVAVFSDPEAAMSAARELKGWSVRAFAEASLEARALPAAQLAPPAHRPRSTAAVASRLIGSALGLRSMHDKAGEASLAAARKQHADIRRQRQASLAATWDDD